MVTGAVVVNFKVVVDVVESVVVERVVGDFVVVFVVGLIVVVVVFLVVDRVVVLVESVVLVDDVDIAEVNNGVVVFMSGWVTASLSFIITIIIRS